MKDPCKTCKKNICETINCKKAYKYNVNKNNELIDKIKSISISNKATPTKKRGSK